MNTFYWLVKREFWEHRGSFLWAPAIATAAVLLVTLMVLITFEIIGGQNTAAPELWQKLATSSPEDIQKFSKVLGFTIMVPHIIVSVTMFFVLFSYCMKALSNDRVDRSILFWKSLPVSDLATVLSKVFSALVLVPVLALVIGSIGSIGMTLMLGIDATLHGAGGVVWNILHPFRFIGAGFGLLPVNMVWMLPTVGWLLLCSAWSKGRVARWAIALPIVIGILISWPGAIINWMSEGQAPWPSSDWYWSNIAARILFGLFPESWADSISQLPLLQLFSTQQGLHVRAVDTGFFQHVGQQYAHLLTAPFLWGALVGIVLLALAVWLRRWRTEL